MYYEEEGIKILDTWMWFIAVMVNWVASSSVALTNSREAAFWVMIVWVMLIMRAVLTIVKWPTDISLKTDHLLQATETVVIVLQIASLGLIANLVYHAINFQIHLVFCILLFLLVLHYSFIKEHLILPVVMPSLF